MNRRTLIASFLGMLPATVLGFGKNKKIDTNGIYRIKTTRGIFWYNEDGKLHREDGPAVEQVNGHREWYQNDKLHRVDGPAVERINGDKLWFQNGELHRQQ